MSHKNRRKKRWRSAQRMERELNELQLMTLRRLETFGWELRFIRRPLFQKAIPVVFDPKREEFATIEEDGSVNDDPGFEIRR